jgi:hypothetical protein
MFAKDALQLRPLDDSVEQRQVADLIGAEFEAVGLGEFAGDDFPFGAAWRGGRTIGIGSTTPPGQRNQAVPPHDSQS